MKEFLDLMRDIKTYRKFYPFDIYTVGQYPHVIETELKSPLDCVGKAFGDEGLKAKCYVIRSYYYDKNNPK